MTAVLPISVVIERLETATTGFVEVDGAAGYGRARGELRRTPAAYAIPLQDSPGPSAYALCTKQRVECRFAVLIAARDVRGDGGIKAATELETLRGSVHAALLGWEPDEVFEAVTYTGGLIVSAVGADGMLVWQADYATAFILEET